MRKDDYKEWLEKELAEKTKRYRNDLVCRAGRVERAFAEIKPDFSLDSEYKRDGGESLKEMLRCWGKDLEGTGIKLPIKSNQMNAITLSVNWYFKYLKENGGLK